MVDRTHPCVIDHRAWTYAAVLVDLRVESWPPSGESVEEHRVTLVGAPFSVRPCSQERQLLSAGGILASWSRGCLHMYKVSTARLALWTQTPSKKNAQQDAGLEVLAAVRGDGVAGLVDWVRSLSPAFRESLRAADGRPRLLPLNSRPTYLSEPLCSLASEAHRRVQRSAVADAFERLAPANENSSERLIVLDYDLARLTSGLRAVAVIAALKVSISRSFVTPLKRFLDAFA